MKTAICYDYNNYKPELCYTFSKIVSYLDPLETSSMSFLNTFPATASNVQPFTDWL